MNLQLESNNLVDYLEEFPPYIVYTASPIQQLIDTIKKENTTVFGQAKLAFEWVRDQISHSFDSQKPEISIGAIDTLKNADGICFAKSHLLVSLLRGLGIPSGFCYQRVLRKGTPDSGFALHGLVALYLPENGWFRVDPRGNKTGINAQFVSEYEQLAYTIRKELGEVDYLKVYVQPLTSVLTAMEHSCNSQELFYKRPTSI